MRILLIEDDEVLQGVLVQSLKSQHYVVDTVEDGQTGLEYAQSTSYDLILMDVGLPVLDGIKVCQKLRASGCSTPVMLITARDANLDRIHGLDAGADDYLIKPLNLEELQARIRALVRRGEVSPTTVLQVGNLRLDPRSCEVSYGEKPLALTPKEYTLLEVFLRNPSRVFSRGQLVDQLWTFDDPPLEESVKAHIKGLRLKLKKVGAIDWIENVYGLGYRLREGVGQDEEDKGSNLSPPSPSASVEQKFQQGINKLWQQYHGLMLKRLQALHACGTAIKAGNFTDSVRQDALQAAHKLAGVLGMFEREAGTTAARAIEQILSNNVLQPAQEQKFLDLVRELDEILCLGDLEASSTSEISRLPSIDADPILGQELQKLRNHPYKVNVLVIDDDPVFLAALHPMLEPWGMQITGLDDPLRFWEVLRSTAPNLLILDVDMPQINGIELCQAVRTDPDWQGLPILFLTARCDRETIQQVFASGADDYINKPVVAVELLTRITNRLERIRLIENLSTKDPITGLANQPQSSYNLQRICKPFCLIVFNIIDLRQINIQHGHAIGNQVLHKWGRLFQNTFRGNEILGYWGNGEFILGMPGLTKQQAKDCLGEILIALRQQVFTAPDNSRFQVTFSFGIAEYPTDGSTLQSLYQFTASRDL